jgi:hypothetical protein
MKETLNKWEQRNRVIQALLDKHGVKYPGCGFDIGDGWLPVVTETLEKMIAAGWDRDLHQVKSKYCTLRIYTGDASDEVYALIREAELKCSKMCENCGAPHGLTVPRSGRAWCEGCLKGE